ncbi:MAG: SAM-dependent methyltransferase, partial [Chromatiales bacterium]|nr:SAM-dependent methyltransferase [Chromatiales bacterium]
MRKDKPSRTAYKVALNLVTLGVKPELERLLLPGLVQATETLLVASGTVGARTVRWARSQRAVSVYEAFDWMLPGQFEAFAHRKIFCERQVRAGLDSGATQILVLGAGYDTLGWRLAPEFPGVNFFEIDHPATARLKARGIQVMGLRGNLWLIAEDLGQRRLADVLTSHESWDQRAPTVIVAEGLVMYLPPEAVRDLFCQCAEIVGVGSRVAFSYIPTGTDGRPDAGRWTGLMLWLQKLVGEPWLWSICPENLSPFLGKTGWENTPQLAGSAEKHGVEFYAVAT